MELFLILIILFFLLFSIAKLSNKGKHFERRIARELLCNSFIKNGGHVIRNVYLPQINGTTSEIDCIYITQKGVFVVECKDYVGYIFGSYKNNLWTVSLYAGKRFGFKRTKKHRFYNPIWQNKAHITCLSRLLPANIKYFSVIVFSNRSSLKSIYTSNDKVFICNQSRLFSVIRQIWKGSPDILSKEDVDYIYRFLLPYTKVSYTDKKVHIENIKNTISKAKICPLCGSALVKRKAKKGKYIGQYFYGCAKYPRCKYIQKIEK